MLSAIVWLRAMLLGSLATSVAIIAVAAIGFLMLTGRIQARRGVTSIIGCFILFSASAIANGIVGALTTKPVVAAELVPLPAYEPSTGGPVSSDPYAGASVPDQRTRDIFK